MQGKAAARDGRPVSDQRLLKLADKYLDFYNSLLSSH
jgi:hypothetical protein